MLVKGATGEVTLKDMDIIDLKQTNHNKTPPSGNHVHNSRDELYHPITMTEWYGREIF